MSDRESQTKQKLGDVKVMMETPDGVWVEVMRKKVDVKKKLGWRVLTNKEMRNKKVKEGE